MAQVGLHGMAGLVVKRWTPERRWLMMGIVLGNLAPDLDNLVVAAVTVAGGNAEGLHRTFTHSLFTAAAIMLLGAVLGRVTKRPCWRNLGLGLGIGIIMHILLDLLIWFDGVQILWPLPLRLNIWNGVQPPQWWEQFMMPAEFLAFFVYFWTLGLMARRSGTDAGFQGRLRLWMVAQGVLFILFTVLVFVMDSGYMTIYGAVYLFSLILAIGVTFRMRSTIESGWEPARQLMAHDI